MPVPMRQSARMGWYLARQRLARREKFPLIAELEPLFQCNLACQGCGKIQHPDHVLRQRMSGRAGRGGDRGVRRPDGLDRRRRASHPSRDRRDRAGADEAQALRLPVHQRDPDAQAHGRLRALPVLRLGGAHRRPARATRRLGGPRRRVRQGRGRDPRGQAPRLPSHHQHHGVQHRLAADGPPRARLPQRRARGRPDDDRAGLRLREGPRPGALPRRRADASALPRCRSPTAGGASGA